MPDSGRQPDAATKPGGGCTSVGAATAAPGTSSGNRLLVSTWSETMPFCVDGVLVVGCVDGVDESRVTEQAMQNPPLARVSRGSLACGVGVRRAALGSARERMRSEGTQEVVGRAERRGCARWAGDSVYQTADSSSCQSLLVTATLRWTSRGCCSSGPVLDARGGDQRHQRQSRATHDLPFAAARHLLPLVPAYLVGATDVGQDQRDCDSMIAAVGGRSKAYASEQTRV